jgi:hypothetical protein
MLVMIPMNHEECSMPTSPDTQLRGDAADHDELKKTGPDSELHLDDEKDTLYDDGLDVEDDSETLADTKGIVHRG